MFQFEIFLVGCELRKRTINILPLSTSLSISELYEHLKREMAPEFFFAYQKFEPYFTLIKCETRLTKNHTAFDLE
jgi:hypothetical protein